MLGLEEGAPVKEHQKGDYKEPELKEAEFKQDQLTHDQLKQDQPTGSLTDGTGDLTAAQSAALQDCQKLLGTILGDKIQIESLIGQGGMSVVYQGRHLVLDRKMAVKVLLPTLGMNAKAVLRLQQEAKAAYSLSHENLASVHDVALTSEGLPYLVMDFAEGETLAEMIKRGPMAPDLAIEIFSQICAGLRAAHNQSVIHRDIKPGNIMVEILADGKVKVKVVDFGIAKKVTENADEIQKLTQTGEVFGTPLYMSPEQCRGDKLDERSDVYALGCVLFEALTGAPPFVGQSSIATIMMHLNKETPAPEKLAVPRGLASVIYKCMEKDPNKRYQSMNSLYNDLQLLKEGEQPVKYNPKRPMPKLLKIGLGLLCTAVIATGYYAYQMTTAYVQNYSLGYQTIEECNDKLSRNHDDFKGYYCRGRLFYARGEYTKAVADFTDAIRLRKDHAFTYAQRAATYNKLGKYDQAIADCDVQIGLERNVAGLHNRAEAYMGKRDWPNALKDADEFLAKYPGDFDMTLLRAKVLYQLDRLDDADTACTRAISLSNQNADAYSFRARINFRRHLMEKALADCNEAIRLNRDANSYYFRSLIFANQKNYEAAMSDIEAFLDLKPNNASASKVKTYILYETGKYEKALEACNIWLQSEPKSAKAYLYRANIYKHLQKLGAAQADKAEYERLKKWDQHTTEPPLQDSPEARPALERDDAILH